MGQVQFDPVNALLFSHVKLLNGLSALARLMCTLVNHVRGEKLRTHIFT